MSAAQTSFEDRLARIRSARQATGHQAGGDMPPPPTKQPSGGARPRSGGGGRGGIKIALVFALGFLILSGGAFAWLFAAAERAQVQTIAAASGADIAGNINSFTRIATDDSTDGRGIRPGVAMASDRPESGELTTGE